MPAARDLVLRDDFVFHFFDKQNFGAITQGLANMRDTGLVSPSGLVNYLFYRAITLQGENFLPELKKKPELLPQALRIQVEQGAEVPKPRKAKWWKRREPEMPGQGEVKGVNWNVRS